MPKYVVFVSFRYDKEYTVEAETPEMAAFDGEQLIIDDIVMGNVSVDIEYVEEINE